MPNIMTQKLYKSRWDIEEFYKQLKHNFKFQNMQEHKTESCAKNINNSLTLTIIKELLLKCYETINEFKNKEIVSKKGNETIKIKKSINENLIFAGIKDVLLKNIIYNELDENKLKIFFKTYINIQCSKEDRHYERKSKRPFTKWYVKKYYDVYKIKKKYLEEEIKKYFLQKNNEDAVKLKLERKEINKEYKKIKKK